MRVLFLVSLLLMSSFVYSRVDSLPIPEIKAKELIAKKWIITDAEVRKQKVKVQDYIPYAFITFLEEGLLVYMGEGDKVTGKWRYKHKNSQIICNTNHDEEIMQIISLTEDEMVVELTIDQDKLKLYFKSI